MGGFVVRVVEGGVVFKVRVVPRSSREEVAGLHGDALKVKLTAPPVEGAANEACLRFLADCLDIPRGQVSLVAGQRGRDKMIEARGVDEARVRRAFGLTELRR